MLPNIGFGDQHASRNDSISVNGVFLERPGLDQVMSEAMVRRQNSRLKQDSESRIGIAFFIFGLQLRTTHFRFI